MGQSLYMPKSQEEVTATGNHELNFEEFCAVASKEAGEGEHHSFSANHMRHLFERIDKEHRLFSEKIDNANLRYGEFNSSMF